MSRGQDLQIYFVMSARELEEKYLCEPIKTVSRGGLFAAGEPVPMDIKGEPPTRRMRLASRVLLSEDVIKITILVFFIVYIIILFKFFKTPMDATAHKTAYIKLRLMPFLLSGTG